MLLHLLNIDHEASVLDMPTVLKVDIFHSPTNKQWNYSFMRTAKSQKCQYSAHAKAIDIS